MTELAAGIDPFEVDLLERSSRGVDEHRLAESHDALLDAWHRALEQDKVILDLAIPYETAHTVELDVSKVVIDCSHMVTYGVMFLLLTSDSVEAFPASVPLPMR